jgi:valyl-tRNA synthetase
MGIKDEIVVCLTELEALLEKRNQYVKYVTDMNEELVELARPATEAVVADPQYSNDMKRKAEINKRIAVLQSYQEKKKQLQSVQDELNNIETTLEAKRYRMKAYDLLTRPLW